MKLMILFLSIKFVASAENLFKDKSLNNDVFNKTFIDIYLCNTFKFCYKLSNEILHYYKLKGNMIKLSRRGADDDFLVNEIQIKKLKRKMRLNFLKIQQLSCIILKNLNILSKIDHDNWSERLQSFLNVVNVNSEPPEDLNEVKFTELFEILNDFINYLKTNSYLIKYQERIYDLGRSILLERKNINC